MRYANLRDKKGGFAQAQKREEQAMFRCYYQAVPLAKMDGHRNNLELVRENLIEGDNDLTVHVFENFLNVCFELQVPGLIRLLDTIKMSPIHPGKGNGYRIPSKHKDLIGYTRARSVRQKWRAKLRATYGGEEVTGADKIEQMKLRLVQGGVA